MLMRLVNRGTCSLNRRNAQILFFNNCLRCKPVSTILFFHVNTKVNGQSSCNYHTGNIIFVTEVSKSFHVTIIEEERVAET
jgi:hypothetical protein